MKTPLKHAELIKQWADGAQIEYYCNRVSQWQEVDHPVWTDYTEYRIKPELKPDKILYGYIGDLSAAIDKAQARGGGVYTSYNCKPNLNVEYTIDGNTGKLKSVKMI